MQQQMKKQTKQIVKLRTQPFKLSRTISFRPLNVIKQHVHLT